MRKAHIYFLGPLILAIGTAGSVSAGYADAVRRGNKAFGEKDYATALEQYRTAETDLPTSPEIDYNIGGTLFEQGKYEEAVDKLTRALNTTDPKLAAAAHFNLGNTHFRMQDYVKAIQSFEESLKMNPQDMDAKFNLELARKMLKEHSQAQQQNQQKQQNQQQKQDQQQQQDEKKDDQQKQDQQQSADQTEKNKDQEQQKKQQTNPKDSKKMSKEDAERILNALRDNEQDTQKKLKRQVQTGEYNGKDW